jgi:CHAD domain-containing protein
MPAETLAVDAGVERDLGTISGLVATYLDRQFEAILLGDAALCRGDHVVVHATRVAVRRYRSVLRVFGPILDRGRAVALNRELAWFAAGLGEVRDRQVLRAHLDDCLVELPPETDAAAVAARINDLLAAEQARAAAALAAQMATRQYAVLLAELRAWQDRLPIEREGPATGAQRFAAKAQATFTRRLADAAGDDAKLHLARKAAKRARYAAELSEPAVGLPAAAAAKRLEEVQRLLGEHQDAVVAAEFLRRVADTAAAAGEDPATYDQLYERERARIAQSASRLAVSAVSSVPR